MAGRPCGATIRRLHIRKVDIFPQINPGPTRSRERFLDNERKFGNTGPAISRRRTTEKKAFLALAQPRNSSASLFGNSRPTAAQQIFLDFASSGLGQLRDNGENIGHLEMGHVVAGKLL